MTKETEKSNVGETIQDTLDGAPSDMSRAIKIGAGALVYTAGLFIMIWMENAPESGLSLGLETTLILSSATAIIAVTFLWIQALGLSQPKEEPVAPSTEKNRRIIILCAVFGGVWAMVFFVSHSLSDADVSDITLLSNSPVPPILAIGTAAILAIGLIYASLEWHKSCDEHERAAINAGLYASLFFYSVATPVWWMVQRSMLVPAQDPMIMYVLVMIIFSAVWTYKRGE